ncbi:MAG TPA: 30S ribosome-binding factor RbfA [Candidatus Moranbacteria bacterium]|nr:30S ribosome-binding factor RbfA [Candidatus Moranbacteria bacterium]
MTKCQKIWILDFDIDLSLVIWILSLIMLMSERIQKINKLIKRDLAEILVRELNLKPGIFLSISKVDTSRDLRYARVFISVFPYKEADYAMKTLAKEIYGIQGALNKKLSMKPLPRLEFELDSTEEQADEIEKILLKL